MSNCSLKLDSTEQEKEQVLKEEYYQNYIAKGYKLKIGQSFNDPDCMAVYLENWKDTTIQQQGCIGCIRAKKRFF